MELAKRVASAAVLAPVVLAVAYLGRPFFEILVGAAALVLAWEWRCLVQGHRLWQAVGFFYIVVPCGALLWLRADPDTGRQAIFWLFAVVWCADTGAYGFGRLIGGAKLSPAISPNKTWSGLWGGVFAAAAAGAATAAIVGQGGVFALAAVSAVVGAISQGGDLAESWVKRQFGVKDMGGVVPGHGGLFDRVDGLLAAAVAVAAMTAVDKEGIFPWT